MKTKPEVINRNSHYGVAGIRTSIDRPGELAESSLSSRGFPYRNRLQYHRQEGIETISRLEEYQRRKSPKKL